MPFDWSKAGEPQQKNQGGFDWSRAAKPQKAPEPEEKGNAFVRGFKSGIDQLQALGGGAVALAGDAIGSDSLKKWGLDVYQDNMDEAAPNSLDYGFTDIDSAGKALEWAGWTLGNLTPTMAASLAGGGVGGLLAKQVTKGAAKKLVQRELARGATKEIAEKKAGELIAKRVAIGSGLGASATSVGMESGSIYGETEDAGVSFTHGLAAGMLDALPVTRLLRKFGGDQVGEGFKKSVIKEAAKQGVYESGTEALQTFIEQHAKHWVENNGESLLANLGETDYKQLIDAAAAGFLGGSAFGAPAQMFENRGLQDKGDGDKSNLDENGRVQFDGIDPADPNLETRDPEGLPAPNDDDQPITFQDGTTATKREVLDYADDLDSDGFTAEAARLRRLDVTGNLPKKGAAMRRPDERIDAETAGVGREQDALEQDQSLRIELNDPQNVVRVLPEEGQVVEPRKPSGKDAFTDQFAPSTELPNEQASVPERVSSVTPAPDNQQPEPLEPTITQSGGQSSGGVGDISSPSQDPSPSKPEPSPASPKEIIDQVFDGAVKNKGGNKIYGDYLDVTPSEATDIQKATGIEVDGYKFSIDESAVRHVLNQHGDAEKEAGRGQEPITKADLENLPDIVLAENIDPDSPVAYSNSGEEIITFKKRVNGHYVVAKAVRTGRKKLALKTMWKTKAARHASPKDEPSPTSETFSPRRPSTPEPSIAPDEAQSIDSGANEAATSPKNDLPEPTEAQKEANNYKKGRIEVHGIKIGIENPKGSVRSGTDSDGKRWESKLHHHYGDITGSKGADGDQIDVFVGEDTESQKVFVVDQIDQKTGEFDEHKVMLGFGNKLKAVAAYKKNYQQGWKVGPVSEMSVDEFKGWLEGDTTKPIAKEEKPKPEEKIKKTAKSLFDRDLAPESQAAPKAEGNDSAQPIKDLGEKIGGARKDTSAKTGRSKKRSKSDDDRPAWSRRYITSEIVDIPGVPNGGKWVLLDKQKKGYGGQMARAVNRYFDTEQDAEEAIPLVAVSRNHRAISDRDGKYEIWRIVTKRKRVKIVDRKFDSREEAMIYMAARAPELIEVKTTFGEADIPAPPDKARTGEARRKGDVEGKDFMEVFGFRGVEFGNWNNQAERQDLLNDAFDGLMDLADVLGVPPKAISLNGDLALAFGARGHGLSGAAAHYERNKAVINLTKMNGAGSLAHEWFHALDHYLGRQDGKATSEWEAGTDGTKSLKGKGSSSDYASHGFSRRGSGVREVVRDAYGALMTTMFKKAEGYVEDTKRADEFVGRARNDLKSRLDSIRNDLAEELDPKYYKRNNKPASTDQLAEYDTIAESLLLGGSLELDTRAIEGSRSKFPFRLTNDSLEGISAIYKAVRGRTGFGNSKRRGILDSLRSDISLYDERLKFLEEAKSGGEKFKTVPTDYAMSAKELDQGRSSDYWTDPHEMAARAFQGYVEDKIAEGGNISRFLTYGPESAVIPTPWGFSRPFPTGKERVAINKALDKFVEALETKETDSGIALFSRRNTVGNRRGSSIAMKDARKVIDRITANWSGDRKGEFEVVSAFDDLPSDIKKTAQEQGAANNIDGVFHKGKTYLVLDGLKTEADVERVIFHETYGHYGIRKLFGKDVSASLNKLFLAIGGAKGLNTIAEKHGINLKAYQRGLGAAVIDGKLTSDQRNQILMDELLAHLQQDNRPSIKRAVKEIIGAIRQWLRRNGFLKLSSATDSELFDLLKKAREAVITNTEGGNSDTRFMVAYHGSPHSFDSFSTDSIGSGEGAQAFGWGLYFASRREVAEQYRDQLSGKRGAVNSDGTNYLENALDKGLITQQEYDLAQTYDLLGLMETMGVADAAKQFPSIVEGDEVVLAESLAEKIAGDSTAKGSIYQVDIPEDGQLLDWDKPLSEQPDSVKEKLTAGDDYSDFLKWYENEASDLGGEYKWENLSVDQKKRQAKNYYRQTGLSYPLALEIELYGGSTGRQFVHDIEKGFDNADKTYIEWAKSRGYDLNSSEFKAKGSDQLASEYLNSLGIPGLKYLDQFSRYGDGDSHNYVIWDDSVVTVEAVNDQSRVEDTAFSIRPDEGMSEIADRILGQPPGDRTLKQRFSDFFKSHKERAKVRLKQGLIDHYAAIEELERASNDGKLLDASESALKAAATSKNANTVLEVAMHMGAVEYRNGGIEIIEDSKGLMEILAPLADNDQVREWELWAGAKRAQRLLEEGRENLYTQDDIDAINAHVNASPEKLALFEEAHREWIEFNKRTLDFAEAAGLIDPEARALWEHDDYVPFHRIAELEDDDIQSGPRPKGGISGQNSGINKLTGGVGRISIVEAMVRNTAHMIEAGMKNVAMQRTINLAEQSNVVEQVSDARISEAEAIERLDQAGVEYTQETLPIWTNMLEKYDARHGTVTVSQEGKTKRYIVHDPLLLRSMTTLGPTGVEGIMKFLRMPKRLLTEAVTADPAFAARNFIRDTISTWVTVEGKKREPLSEAIKGVISSYKNSDAQKSLMAMGVGGGGFYDTSPDGARRHLQQLEGGKNVIRTVGDAWRAYRKLLGTTENANRIAIYENALKNGATKAEAAYQALDVLNFSRHGDFKAIRILIELVPFMNARLQGLDRLWRGAKEGTDQWYQFNQQFLMKGGILMGATLALMAANMDNEDYWDLPEWERDTYYHFWIDGEHFRLPKPFEVGSIFSTIPERVIEQAVREDADMALFGERMLTMFADTFALDPTPQFIKPAIEVGFNENRFTGRQVISEGMKFVAPEAQYTPFTSKAFVWLADAMPDAAPNWLRSPAKLEHLYNGYFGTLGRYATEVVDFGAVHLMGETSRPQSRSQDFPVVGTFYRDGVNSNKHVGRVYDMSREVRELHSEIKKYQDEGRTDMARKRLEAGKDKLKARAQLNSAVRDMGKISAEMRKIYDNKVLSPEAKRKRIDALTERRNELAKKISERYWDLF